MRLGDHDSFDSHAREMRSDFTKRSNSLLFKGFLFNLIFWLVIIAAVFIGYKYATAGPTSPADHISWDDPDNDPGIVSGYYLYYTLESEPVPRAYGDTRRVDMGKPSNLSGSIKTFLPQAKGMMCFQATAYDHLKNESGYSNEYCAWQGMGNPKNLGP
jgi:hypothetical protein